MIRLSLTSLAVLLAAASLAGCSIDVTGRVIPNFDGGADMRIDMTLPDGGIDSGRDMTMPPIDGGPDMLIDEGIDQGIDEGVDMPMPADMGIDEGIDFGMDMFVPDDMGIDEGVDAGVDEGVDEGVDAGPTCTTGAAPVCSDADTLMTCPSGVPVFHPCSLGCATDPSPQCRTILPSNLSPAVSFSGAVADMNTGSVDGAPYWYIDTETGQIAAYNESAVLVEEIRGAGMTGVDAGIRYAQRAGAGGGANLGIFAMRSLIVAPGTVLIVGGARAFVLLVSTSVDIQGPLLANADVIPSAPAPGPGGGLGGAFDSPGTGPGHGGGGIEAALGLEDSGGGGASFGTAGGLGGMGGILALSPAASAPYGADDLIPLFGGSGGGGGGDNDGGSGGNGGGAVQISATDYIHIWPAGSIDVSGSGGHGGLPGATDSGGGGGGGSGGAILLESGLVQIQGYLAANGGAGGQASGCTATCMGENGANGSYTMVPAAGSSDFMVGGGGGAGSDATGVAANGNTAENGGGGGGGGGRIRINNYTGSLVFGTGVTPTAATTVGVAAATP